MTKLISLAYWALSHKTEALVYIASFVGGASAAVQALYKLAVLLEGVAPWLKPLEGPLLKLSGALNSAASWGPLNAVALNPKSNT